LHVSTYVRRNEIAGLLEALFLLNVWLDFSTGRTVCPPRVQEGTSDAAAVIEPAAAAVAIRLE
jgi:hypothetical protein